MTRDERKITRSFVAVTVVFVVLLAGLGVVIKSNRDLARDGANAHDSLCLIRANFERRIARSEQYLKEVRTGRRDPIEGITTADIQQSIREERATVDDLGLLDCVPPPPQPEGGS